MKRLHETVAVAIPWLSEAHQAALIALDDAGTPVPKDLRHALYHWGLTEMHWPESGGGHMALTRRGRDMVERARKIDAPEVGH